jgi:MFS family permease
LFGSIFSIGMMIGPIFGGLFVSYWSWRGIFLVNVPIGVAVIVLALRYIPRDQSSAGKNRAKMDITGMLLLGGGILSGMLAISYLAERNAEAWSPVFIVPMALSIVALWMFFRHINRSASPFIAPRLISGSGFGTINLINGLYGGITSGVIALVPLYAWNRYGINELHSGTLLIAQGAASIIFSVAGAFALRRTGYRLPMYVGGAVIVAGMLLLALSPVAAIAPYLWLAGSSLLIGIGRGANNPASRNAGLQLAPEHSSTLAALRTLSMQIGTIFTISVDTAILANSHDPGRTQAVLYAIAGAILIAAFPLITRVPEHRGSW